ncbi:uncharacterized protein BO95DRAFT_448184 [Aspergillus brunneoviolaceus CBS 621.78]|uniref:Uncharacterized protein n=1 Tax=Aspergillus brunneoviolaceus CBS 621.78 TaxID=1450534 RepID=A0ACD1FT11_9EURO|nr:hypothetical protein BO95DRAFT_448184 [Aspergillus brunneoviolaceus CBS 621.78]RAH40097.1 hypothetical protein BO95DRAFT_448184 [Aspergillus brunneoviolaceus CBS 621.78]
MFLRLPSSLLLSASPIILHPSSILPSSSHLPIFPIFPIFPISLFLVLFLFLIPLNLQQPPLPPFSPPPHHYPNLFSRSSNPLFWRRSLACCASMPPRPYLLRPPP